ncbi:metallophosphoesterase [Gammaproteobacteria bacterium]|nr:metallophosphoesterase [Gammaproteobacteria bacterium]
MFKFGKIKASPFWGGRKLVLTLGIGIPILLIAIVFVRSSVSVQNISFVVSNSVPKYFPYSFIVAGHTYGSHSGKNPGLYTKFYQHLSSKFLRSESVDFIVLTGDIVRESDQKSWDTVGQQMENLGLPYFFVMGNHDISNYGIEVFKSLYRNTFYSFSILTDLYIILDSQQKSRSISEPQLKFVKSTLKKNRHAKRIFIFFHELLWNSAPEYQQVLSNGRSRYQNIQESNYWTDLHPMFSDYPDKLFYVIAGDVGGNSDAISVFHDAKGNVTLIASGMGEVEDENFVVATALEDAVTFRLIPLNPGVQLEPLDYY